MWCERKKKLSNPRKSFHIFIFYSIVDINLKEKIIWRNKSDYKTRVDISVGPIWHPAVIIRLSHHCSHCPLLVLIHETHQLTETNPKFSVIQSTETSLLGLKLCSQKSSNSPAGHEWFLYRGLIKEPKPHHFFCHVLVQRTVEDKQSQYEGFCIEELCRVKDDKVPLCLLQHWCYLPVVKLLLYNNYIDLSLFQD